MTVIIKDYNSPVFPISCTWNAGNNTAVYSTIEDAKRAMIGRFGDVKFIDRREARL